MIDGGYPAWILEQGRRYGPAAVALLYPPIHRNSLCSPHRLDGSPHAPQRPNMIACRSDRFCGGTRGGGAAFEQLEPAPRPLSAIPSLTPCRNRGASAVVDNDHAHRQVWPITDPRPPRHRRRYPGTRYLEPTQQIP